MANKKSHLDPATRIRNNQRRARQRQKDLVADLQKRVTEYEQKGVQASLQLQSSARYVAQENRALKALLAAGGVGEEEVSRWVDGFEREGQSASCGKTSWQKQSLHEARGDDGGLRQPACSSSSKSCKRIKVAAQHSQVVNTNVERSYCSGKRAANEIVFDLQDKSDQKPRHMMTGAQKQGMESDNAISATSCIEAAEMLVAIRGQDRDQVMLSLGCKSGTDCRIMNTELLDIMDS